MTRPVRIQRRRVKGFDLQAESRAINGLECVTVDRSTNWGNPYRDSDGVDAELLVQLFRHHMNDADGAQWKRKNIHLLRGKNLACWCALDAPCHADVLLEIANEGMT